MERYTKVMVLRVVLGAACGGALAAGAAGSETPRASTPITVSADGNLVLVANPESDSLSLVETTFPRTIAEIPVGDDPRSVSVSDDGRRAYVANRGCGTLSVVDVAGRREAARVAVGRRPSAVVLSHDGRKALVSLEAEARVISIDTTTLRPESSVSVAPRPSGLAVTGDRVTVMVTHRLAGSVSVIELTPPRVVAEIVLYPDSNLVSSITLSHDGRIAYVPHTRSNSNNPHLTFDTTVFPLVSLLDVEGRVHLSGRHLSLDTIDPPGVGLPAAAAVALDGSRLFVVNAASNDLSVIGLADGRLHAHLEVGDHPRGIAMAPDGSAFYVTNELEGSVSVIDAAALAVTATIPVTAIPLPPTLLEGKRLFHSSDDPRLSRAQWISCASCHVDGGHDGRTWKFGFAGPRNTTDLHGMVQTYPLRWSAEWDEAADSEFAIVEEQFGVGLLGGNMHAPLGPANGGRSWDLDCLAAFLDGLEAPQNELRSTLDDGAVARGRALFDDPVVGCADCHPPPYFTDFAVHDVGTADGPDERLGPEIDTPTLRGLADSAPYLHDGSAATLRAVLTSSNSSDLHGVTSHLSDEEVTDLETYLLSIPANNHGRRDGSSDPPRVEPGARPPLALPKLQALQPSNGRRRVRGRFAAGALLSGMVVEQHSGEPVPGALVSVRASSHRTEAAPDGTFRLWVPISGDDVEVTAWAPGHYIASQVTGAPMTGLVLELRHHHTADNSEYQWIDPMPDPAVPDACGNCHPSILPQWSGNAHGGAVDNPRFFSFYNGTDVTGTVTVEPGYLIDFPGTAGNCATCHAPGAAVDAPFSTDMNAVRGQTTAGIHCDFCHKVGGAHLRARGPRTAPCGPCHVAGPYPLESQRAEPYPNMPGVLSMRLLRPPPSEQIFIGPFPDIHDPDTYAPLMHSSAYCAPCHQFSFWGTPIYESYGEWLASPYSDAETGQTCQDCHMIPNGDSYFALPEQGGLAHPPDSIPSHLQVGATDEGLLRSTVELAVDGRWTSGAVDVTVTLTNVGAGHHVPTDHPGRHLLLLVEAFDEQGSALEQTDGPTVPFWGGAYEGAAGSGFAKLLEDVASGDWPVVSYWKQTVIVADTRLPALGASVTSYRFAAPPSGVAHVTARVIFRRLFEGIAERYGWQLGEVVMEEATVTLDR